MLAPRFVQVPPDRAVDLCGGCDGECFALESGSGFQCQPHRLRDDVVEPVATTSGPPGLNAIAKCQKGVELRSGDPTRDGSVVSATPQAFLSGPRSGRASQCQVAQCAAVDLAGLSEQARAPRK